MTNDDRATYLAAADKLELIVREYPSVADMAVGASRLALDLPAGPAQTALRWPYLRLVLRTDERDTAALAWYLLAAALKLRQTVEEACLG